MVSTTDLTYDRAISPQRLPVVDARGKVVENTGAADSFGYLAIGPVINSNFASAGSSATYTVDALGNRRTARVANNQTNGGTDSSRYEAGTGRLAVTLQKHMGVIRPDSTLSWFNGDGSLSGTDAHRVLGCTASPCVVQSAWILEVRSTANRYDAAGHLVASTFQFDTIPWLSPKPYATYRRTSAYRYDALGRRVWQRVVRGPNCYQKEEYTGCRSTLTRTVWDGDQVLFELRTPGDSVAGGAETSESDGASGYGAGYGRVGYVHGGGIDAPLELFKESAVVVPHANWRGVYDSGTCPTSACASTVQFPGGQGTAGVFGDGYNPDVVDWYGSVVWAQQDASGYQYKRNRYYDPKSGRFTQEDPIGLAGGLNLYGYANGDPVNFSDPFGLCTQCMVNAGVQFMSAMGSRAMDPVNERRISGLDQSVQTSARMFTNFSAASGNPIRVTQGLRSFAEQDALYAQGRTTDGNIVTNARGGQSYHNFGLAIDVAPVQDGRANPRAFPSAQTVRIGQALGWEWGGDWMRFKDRPHFQMTGGNSLEELQRGQQ